MRSLVTGGAGFIGSHIVDRLIQEGSHVRVLDNFSSGARKNLEHLKGKVEIIEGDICDPKIVKKSMQDVDYVFHEAALKLVPESFKNPHEYNRVNIDGILLLLMEAYKNKIKKFVYASSSSVYGDNPELPKQESAPVNPISPYAVTKLTGEFYCSIFTRTYGLPTISLRYFNVFGPRQTLSDGYSNVIPKFIGSYLKNISPPIYGDGKQSRDFTHVDNVVLANLLAIKKPEVSGIYNVGTGERHDLLSIIDLLSQLLHKKVTPTFLPPQPGDVRHTLASIENVKKALNYKALLSFKDGLWQTVEWFRDHLT